MKEMASVNAAYGVACVNAACGLRRNEALVTHTRMPHAVLMRSMKQS
jgi:hypothetical protein